MPTGITEVGPTFWRPSLGAGSQLATRDDNKSGSMPNAASGAHFKYRSLVRLSCGRYRGYARSRPSASALAWRQIGNDRPRPRADRGGPRKSKS